MKIQRIGYNPNAALIRLEVEKDDKIMIDGQPMNAGKYNYTAIDGSIEKIVNTEEININIEDRKTESKLLASMTPELKAKQEKIPVVEIKKETFVFSDYTNYIKGKEDFQEAAKTYLSEVHAIIFE